MHKRETAKKTDRSCLFLEGKGLLLTDTDIIATVAAMDREQAEKEAGKAAQKVANTTARSAKAAAQAEWERTKLKHADDVRDWATEVERLRQAGVPRKDLPKKPVCPLQPIAGQPERQRAPRC
jgi:hypothetical protein